MATPGQIHIGAQCHSKIARLSGLVKFMALFGGLAIAWSPACYAQQPHSAPLKRVGVLNVYGCPISSNWATTRRLAELGWVEGQNFVFECVSTVGRLDQLPALTRELVSRHPDVLVAGPVYFVRALKQETTTIPMVMFGPADPLRNDLITSLARPEGNVTGVGYYGGEVSPKRFGYLKEIVPHLSRWALVASVYLDLKAAQTMDEDVTIAASALGFTWQRFRAAVANDYEIFDRIAAEHFDAAYVQPDPLTQQNVMRVIELALHHRIPTVVSSPDWAKRGLLLGYGPTIRWIAVRGAEYVDKILRGAKPSDLPVEQPTKLELVINLKTAKALV
jgi:putative tryptophan/tyrosine transport system substrate-binding protein